MCKRILKWWNNLPFCRKKREKWFETKHINQAINDGMLGEIKWPKDVFYTKLADFKESDWVYSSGDRCERYVAWFFKWITKRCTILERTPEWIPMDTPTGIGGWHPDGYVTAYKVVDDSGDIQKNVHQSDLSY